MYPIVTGCLAGGTFLYVMIILAEPGTLDMVIASPVSYFIPEKGEWLIVHWLNNLSTWAALSFSSVNNRIFPLREFFHFARRIILNIDVPGMQISRMRPASIPVFAKE